MEIAIITPYRSFAGGVEVVTKQIELALRMDGHNITWFTIEGYHKNFKEKVLAYFVSDAIITSKLFNQAGKKFDVVLCNGEYSYGISHSCCINVFHGSYFGFYKYLKKSINLKAKIRLKILSIIQRKSSRTKHIIAVSKFLQDILEEQNILVDEIINNSVDTNKFLPQEIPKNGKFLFVGSYNYYGKGFDILHELAKRGVKIDCVTNQQPPEPLGWIKTVSSEELSGIYNRYKGLIFPSRFESSGMVALEALSSGLPIFMSNVGIGTELKEQIPEFVIDGWGENVIDEYMQKIKFVDRNYLKFSHMARDYVVENHSLEDFNRKWLNKIYQISRC